MNKWIRPWALGVAGVIALGGVWIGRGMVTANAADPSAPTAAPAAAPAVRSVEVVSPKRQTMARGLDVSATLEAFEKTDIYARASGYVADVRVDIGDRVKANDALAVLDVPEMADELRQAEAMRAAKVARVEALRAKARQAALAIDTARAEESARAAELELQEATAKRKEELFTGKAIPEQEVDEARSRLTVARSQRETARARRADAEGEKLVAEAEALAEEADIAVADAGIARLKTLAEYAIVRAPFDGVVTMRNVDHGALVQAAPGNRTTPLFTIQRVDRMRVFLDVPESDVAFVHPGATTKVTPYGLRETLTGPVARIATSLNPATRTMRTEIDLPNPDGRLLDGMYVQVALDIDVRPNVLTVPATALLTEGKETYVYTVRDVRAVRTPVKTGLDDGVQVEITGGLDEGDAVILAGKGLVTDGMPVHAVQRGTAP